MRKLLCGLLALLLMSACTFAPEKKKPGWVMATSGEQYERLLWDAVKAKDWKAIESHMADTVVTQTPDAVRNKQQTMEHIRQLDLSDYSLGDLQTETAGADLIVTYTFTGKGTIGGHPLPPAPMHMMTVWQQVKGGMVMVAHTTMPSSQ